MSPHHFWQRLGKEKKCTIKWSWECLDWNPMSYQICILGYVCTAYYARTQGRQWDNFWADERFGITGVSSQMCLIMEFSVYKFCISLKDIS